MKLFSPEKVSEHGICTRIYLPELILSDRRIFWASVPVRLQGYAAVIILCQMTITASLYKQIPTETVQKGMILSTSSTVQMQPSRVRGLPGVSREDLRDRLTDEQASSVRRWGKTEKGSPVVTIMRKVPFAIFLVLGYAMYFLMWSILK